MSGMNLSQSVPEEESTEDRSFFDGGFILSLSLILLSAIAFGGVRLYIGSLDKKIATVEETLSANAQRLSGENIDRIADFDSRLNYFSANKSDFSDTQEILSMLEKRVLPDTVLKKFEYNPHDKVIFIEGESDDFKKLAEQIMAFKDEKIFSNMEVQTLDREEASLITFTLKVTL